MQFKVSQMPEEKTNHYDENYFTWQTSLGEFGGWADQSKFVRYLSGSDTVLDFGCGGGFLLKGLKCRKKLGIEVNLSAVEFAKKNGVEVFMNAEDVVDDCVDIIISNHALEHSLQPLKELKILYKKLKAGGKIIFIVPCESISCSYKPNDINHHLYSWSPMCIGNLFKEAGFSVIESKPYFHKWPPFYRFVARVGGRKIFDIACSVFGKFSKNISQVKIVATKQ